MCVSIDLTYWNSKCEWITVETREVGGKCLEPFAVDRRGQEDFFTCRMEGGACLDGYRP